MRPLSRWAVVPVVELVLRPWPEVLADAAGRRWERAGTWVDDPGARWRKWRKWRRRR